VLLFAHVAVPGVAWLRIASAAVVFAIWRRPWRLLARMSASQRCVLLALGVVLAVMNSLFYLAVDRLPLSTVGAIEFLGTVMLAAAGAPHPPQPTRPGPGDRRGRRALTDVRPAGQPLGSCSPSPAAPASCSTSSPATGSPTPPPTAPPGAPATR